VFDDIIAYSCKVLLYSCQFLSVSSPKPVGKPVVNM